MCIFLPVHEPYSFKQLPSKALHIPFGIPMMPILLDDIIERRPQRLEHHAEMPVVVERLSEPHDVCSIVWISLVQNLYYVSLNSGRTCVFLYWLDYLHKVISTFIATLWP